MQARAPGDSLYLVWHNEDYSDSIRTEAAYQYIFGNFVFSKPDSAILLTEEFMDFTKTRGYQRGEASALRLRGTIDLYQARYREALRYYEQSLNISMAIGDSSGMSSTYGNMGIVFSNQGDYTRALRYHIQNLQIVEALGLRRKLPKSLGNIGVLYSELREFDKALDYYSRGLVVARELGMRSTEARTLENIGNVYGKQGMYAQALEYYERSLEAASGTGDVIGRATTQVNIAIIHKNLKEFDTALSYLWQSQEIAEKYGNKRLNAYVYLNIGICNLERHEYTAAITNCRRALTASQAIQVLYIQRDACECLYKTYRETGQNALAIDYLEMTQSISDTLAAHEAEEKLQAMEFRRAIVKDSLTQEAEKREVEEQHQKEIFQKTRARNTMMGVGLFALLLAGGFYSRWRYTRRAKETIEKERQRSENLLLNILPAEIAEELKDKGKADARQFDAVTILFTDFKDFTALSQQMEAQELVSEINACFEAFDAICQRHGVEKIKTIGDSYMAAGGLPVPDHNSASSVVSAAFEMMEFMAERKRIRQGESKVAFEMRAGLHSGSVVAGIVGVQKFQYDIWGDTVNTASRIESASVPGKINISASTYAALRDDPQFEFEYRGRIEVKGKGGLEMYFVDRALH